MDLNLTLQILDEGDETCLAEIRELPGAIALGVRATEGSERGCVQLSTIFGQAQKGNTCSVENLALSEDHDIERQRSQHGFAALRPVSAGSEGGAAWTHPAELGERDIEAFLTHLAPGGMPHGLLEAIS